MPYTPYVVQNLDNGLFYGGGEREAPIWCARFLAEEYDTLQAVKRQAAELKAGGWKVRVL